MPANNKTCGICDVVLPHTDRDSIVSHYALCVHSYCEKNGSNQCMCISCSGIHKQGKRAKKEEKPNTGPIIHIDSFSQAIDSVSQFLTPTKLLEISTLNRAVFRRVKPLIEARLWFSLHGTFQHYYPINVFTISMNCLKKVPRAAKQVWFEPHINFNQPINSLPNNVTHMSIPSGFHQHVPHWPSSLVHLKYVIPDGRIENTIRLPSTLEHLEVNSYHGVDLTELLSLKTLIDNGQLDYSFLPATLQELHMGDFNKPISLPPNLRVLIMKRSFNQPFTTLPSSLKVLVLSDSYSHELPQPLPPLYELRLGPAFRHSSLQLPPSLKTLSLTKILPGSLPQYLISLQLEKSLKCPLLPPSLNDLKVTFKFYPHTISHPIPDITSLTINSDCLSESLPTSLQELTINNCRKLPSTLPPNLIYLTVGHEFTARIKNLPSSLKHLTLGTTFNSPLPHPLPPNLAVLAFIGRENEYTHKLPHPLPKTIVELKLGDAYNHPIEELPLALRKLTIGHKFNSSLPHQLPPNLRYLKIGNAFSQDIPMLPPALEQLILGKEFNAKLPELLPSSLSLLHLGNKFKMLESIPPGLDRLEVSVKAKLPPIPATLRSLRVSSTIVPDADYSDQKASIAEEYFHFTLITEAGLHVEFETYLKNGWNPYDEEEPEEDEFAEDL